MDLRSPEGQELRGVLSQPKRIALLAYLALATPRGLHRRDTLVALFWPEDDAEHARNSLSQSVHVLRRFLGADTVVSHNGDALGLEWEGFWCDAVAFEEAVEAGRLGDALDLYRGELLEGFHVARAPEFERWLEAERARLGGRFAQALEAVAHERQNAGDFDGAVRQWRRLASRDPYDSRVALRLMRALAAAGDPAGAVQHARVHETLLREELGVAPDAEISAFVRQLPAGQHAERSHPVRDMAGRTPAAVPAAAEPVPAAATLRGVTAEDPGLPAATNSARIPAAPPDAAESRRLPRSRRAVMMTAGLATLSVAGLWAAVLQNGAAERSVPPIRSLAVLPFENLSGDSAHQAFADGMHDALIAELGRYPSLTVISRTSVLQYRGTKRRLPEIARELGVDGVVEGAVLRDGGRVRMTAQLVHGPSDRPLWTRSYQRDLRDILSLQGELAAAIAREVSVAAAPLARTPRTATGAPDSAPPELYLRELYLRGRHAELSRSLVGLQTAREAYRRAIERDSTFALGFAGLAGVYGFMADYNYVPMGPALDTARMMARRALALDSTIPETRTALAVTLGDAGQFEAAEREFKRAVELGPSNARAHYWYSVLLVALGRGEEALRHARRAAELDPFAPRGVVAMQWYAEWLVTGKRSQLKLPVTQRRPILSLDPGEPWARARQAEELAQAGRCAEARSEIQRARQHAPGHNFRMLPFVGAVHWYCGEHGRARRVLEDMKQHPDARNHGYRIAVLHTHFGERDSALVWLGRNRWTMAELSGLSADWWLDPLRSDPRFAQLLSRLGIR